MGSGGTKTKTTSNETAVTTPNTFAGAMPSINQYYGTTVPNLFNVGAENVAPGLNGLQMVAQDKAIQGLGQNSGAYDMAGVLIRNAIGQINQVAPATASTASLSTAALPNAITAQQAALPERYQAASVARTATPTAAQASVADLPTAALAADTSGLAGKDVNTFGGVSAVGGINQYLNPQLDGYVKAALANFDDTAGRQQAAYAAQGAKNNAFGGSRFGIGEAQLLSDQARGRALTDAELRSDAWKTALSASSADADRGNAAGIASMQAKNSRDELLAQLAQSYGLANADATNNFRMAGFNAENTANLSNTDAINRLLSQAYGIDANANSQDAAARNNALSQFYSTEAANNQFNTGQANDLASMLYQSGLQNNQFNTGQANANSQFNAGVGNDMSRFNTDLAMQQGQAGITAGNSLSNILSQQGDSYRNDISTMGNLGNSLWGIQQQQGLAPYTQAGLLSEAINPQLLAQLSGQTITSNGTNTSKQSGGLLGSILGSAAQLGSAALMASERRVKRNIRHLGAESDGLGVYAYNYVWDDETEPLRVGVMVDEVARLRPWALGPVVDGIQTVDYSRLREAF